MAGALDLFAGTGSVSGVNGFTVDHSPLDQFNLAGALQDALVDPIQVIVDWLEDILWPAIQSIINFDVFGSFADFLNSIFSLIEGLGNFDITEVLKTIAKVLNFPDMPSLTLPGLSEWVLNTIFGLIAPDRIPILPIGHLIFDRVNLLTNPQFTEKGIDPVQSGDWVRDDKVNRSGVGGSARIDADSTINTLLSTDLIPVHGLSLSNAQQLHLEMWVKTEGFVGPAGCVQAGLVTYKTVDGSDTPVFVDLMEPTFTTNWKQWTDDWIVTPGVVAVRYQITVSEEATAGKIWFDDLFLGKNGLLQSNWVDGLEQLIQDFGAAAWATLTDIAEAIEDIIKKILGPTAFQNLEDWAAHVGGLGQAITDALNEIGAKITEGITNFVQTVFGGFADFNTFEEFISHVIDSLKPEAIFDAIKDFIDGLLAGLASIQHVADEIGAALTAFVTSIFGGFTFNTFEEFITHVVDSLKPQAIFDSIKTQITTLINSIAATIASVIAEIERLTGLNIDQGPIPFLQSLVGALAGQPAIQIPSANITAPAGSGFANIGVGLQTTWSQWFGAFTGKPPESQQTDIPGLTATEIKELLATTAANATALAALQAVVTNNVNNMVASGDDFEDGADLSVRWTKVLDTGTGGFSVAPIKGQAAWTDVGNAPGYEKFFRKGTDAATITEYQKVTRVTGTVVAESTLLTAAPGVDYIYGRASGTGNYIYAWFDGDGKVSLGYGVGGVETQFPGATAVAAKPTAGTTYSLECGDIQSARKYRLLRNNSPVLTYTDTGNLAAAVTGKGWGWGGKSATRFTGQSTPSSLHSVSVVDIPPTPTLGTVLVAVRRSTTKITKPVGDTTLPANTFDEVVVSSPDVSFSLTSNIILISKEGPYVVSARMDTGTDLTQSEEWELLLYEYVGGVPVIRRRGGQMGGPNTAFATSAGSALDATFQFYSAGANRQWAVGFRSTASESIVGDALGSTTYLTLTRGT